ncbi:thiol-disulfide oxidoreductase DCC family protein [Streptomyces sp. NPDC094448]|uniref:thiol-disulfide oxidoreductase DCC family protein n=1 Tax=Streptomyces sp. NPDC094448 TaxID=3366063 RepID=UPI0037F4CA79
MSRRDGRGGPVHRLPVHRLTVLFDAECGLCAHVRDWLARQRQLVPLDLVPAGSALARELFPGLDHQATLRRITVVGDRGQVYTDDAAFLVCLWALADHRDKAAWLVSPAGKPFIRAAVLAASAYRESTGAAGRGLGGTSGEPAGSPDEGSPCDDRCPPPG